MNSNICESVSKLFGDDYESERLKYIEYLGESVINEEAKSIKDKLYMYKESGNFDSSKLADLILSLNESLIDESTKKILIESIMVDFINCNSSNIDIEAVSESFSLPKLKFDGNSEANKEFIDILDEINKFLEYNADVVDEDFNMAENILKCIENHAKSAKDASDIKKCISDCLNILDKGNSKFEKEKYEKFSNTYKKFFRLRNSFNNKYSKITMLEKEKIDAKLDQLLTSLYNSKVKDWFYFEQYKNKCVNTDRLNKAYVTLKEIDRDSAVELSERIINPLYSYLAKCWSAEVRSVMSIRSLLDIEIKDTLKWKIVHKIFK